MVNLVNRRSCVKWRACPLLGVIIGRRTIGDTLRSSLAAMKPSRFDEQLLSECRTHPRRKRLCDDYRFRFAGGEPRPRRRVLFVAYIGDPHTDDGSLSHSFARDRFDGPSIDVEGIMRSRGISISRDAIDRKLVSMKSLGETLREPAHLLIDRSRKMCDRLQYDRASPLSDLSLRSE